jgi:hypothetical protein
MYIYDDISLSSSSNERGMFQTNVVGKIKTHILRSINLLPENRAVYEILWKNMIEPDRP